ncbi:hypothetical protein CFP66_41550 [Pseudonocardia sp. MH-G8]|nr:hypothetical protein CFP66_41550 [Pseudonocardia sp. MH-G8]
MWRDAGEREDRTGEPEHESDGNRTPPNHAIEPGRSETPRYPLVPVVRICTHARSPKASVTPNT